MELAGSAPPALMKIAFSDCYSNQHVTVRYLADTFAPGFATHFDLETYKPNVSVLKLLEIARTRGEMPDVLAHTIVTPGLPRDLDKCPIPTVALDIDSFGWTESRIRWSMLFDHVFLWHLSLVPKYKAAGHPKVVAMPHAVDADFCRGALPTEERPLDLGWIGAFQHGHYARRKRIVSGLAARFKMNDYMKFHTKAETADVYRNSKIVVNVSRDEFPPEANMRCYEAMGAGALLITQMPTELTEWGFRENVHFVGWRNESEIPDLVDFHLRHEKERIEIARAGQELTLKDFTFQKCRDKMNAVLAESPKEFFAPARKWTKEQVSLVHVEYYYRVQLIGALFEEFASLKGANPRARWKALPMLLKTLRHSMKNALW